MAADVLALLEELDAAEEEFDFVTTYTLSATIIR